MSSLTTSAFKEIKSFWSAKLDVLTPVAYFKHLKYNLNTIWQV